MHNIQELVHYPKLRPQNYYFMWKERPSEGLTLWRCRGNWGARGIAKCTAEGRVFQKCFKQLYQC